MDEFNEAIRASAMLVSYRTSAWSARIKDPAAAKAAAQALGITTSALSTSKNLMDGADTRLRAVVSAQEAGRMIHAQFTLPWTTDSGSRGPRMLPTTSWLPYMKKIAGAKTVYDKALADFLSHYEADRDAAQARINMVGDPLHVYPPPEKIEGFFTIAIDFSPIPAGTHFRGLPDQFREQLEAAYEGKMRTRMAGAMSDAFARARDAVENLAERLEQPEPTFKSAAVENVRELAPMLRAWNLGNDEDLASLASQVEKLVDGEDMKSLKASEDTRRLVAREGRAIVAWIDGLGVIQP